jgi:malate synthase
MASQQLCCEDSVLLAPYPADGAPVCAAVLGTALTCFWAGAEHARRGEGVFFYIPKTESAAEVKP